MRSKTSEPPDAGACAVCCESCAAIASHRATSDSSSRHGIALDAQSWPSRGSIPIRVPQRQCSLAANGLDGSPPHRLTIHAKVDRARVCFVLCSLGISAATNRPFDAWFRLGLCPVSHWRYQLLLPGAGEGNYASTLLVPASMLHSSGTTYRC
jgi:hypothetical protein